MTATTTTHILRLSAAEDEKLSDELAVEEPLEIRIEGHSIAVVMRTPGEDGELAAGFLLSEGIIRAAKDVFDIATCVAPAENGNVVDVALAHPNTFDPQKLSRHVFTSASCGLCGKTSIEAVLKRRKPLDDSLKISSSLVAALPRKLSHAQANFRRTGGLHGCGLFDAEGQLIGVREDVGRHNALDKLIGWSLLQKRTPLAGHVLLLSGRASFEMMQKAYAAGIPVVIAIGAPSSLAVNFARESGQTLVGFLRGKSMNVYAGAERVIPEKH